MSNGQNTELAKNIVFMKQGLYFYLGSAYIYFR